MHTPNSQVAHARKCVGGVEDAISRMEMVVTRRLQCAMGTTAEERYIHTLRDKLGEFRTKLEALEIQYPEG